MLNLTEPSLEELTRARFEHHVQSMSRLASVLLCELRGPMTRLLYDAEFIGRAAEGEDRNGLRETISDVHGSSLDLQIWVQRLARFVERGVDASEQIDVAGLLRLASRAARASKRQVPTSVEHRDPGLAIVTNVVLATEMIAELQQMAAEHAGATELRICTESTSDGTGVAISFLPGTSPSAPMENGGTLPSAAGDACPSSLDVLQRTVQALGGSLAPRPNLPGCLDLVLPGPALDPSGSRRP